MSFDALKWAMAQCQPDLSAGAKLVLMVLADAYNQKAQHDPYLSLKTISYLARIRSNTTLSKHISELEELGLVERRKRPNASNIYVLSGAPDFKLAVQKMDSEFTVEAEVDSPVSGQAYPVSEGGYSEIGPSVSNTCSRTTKTTNLNTKNNHAFGSKGFSANEDKGFGHFLTVFKTQPVIHEEARAAYRNALARGAQVSVLLAAAAEYASMVANGISDEIDPADWLRDAHWTQLESDAP